MKKKFVVEIITKHGMTRSKRGYTCKKLANVTYKKSAHKQSIIKEGEE